ncbi:MAG TPA: addiction module protein [Tepidisphaeraceae bacterium]|nr:addiction module protein [Tepidisphaeraceae bacterium]
MSDKLKNLVEVAMTLSREERAEAVALLIDSLDDEDQMDSPPLSDAWVKELDSRCAAYERGEAKSVPIEKILQMLRQRNYA